MRIFFPPAKPSQAKHKMAIRQDLLGSIAGFDGWWEAQRRAAAPAAPASHASGSADRHEPFSLLLPTTHLKLSATAAEAPVRDARVPVRPLVFSGAGPAQPPPAAAPPPPPPAPLRPAASEAAAAGAQAFAVGGPEAATRASAARHRGSSTAVRPRHGSAPPTPAEAAAAFREGVREGEEAAAGGGGRSGRRRRKAWDGGGGGGGGGGDVRGGGGLFDPSLRLTALREEERRLERRASAATLPLSALEEQLGRVRAWLRPAGGGGAAEGEPRLGPSTKAQLRRLVRRGGRRMRSRKGGLFLQRAGWPGRHAHSRAPQLSASERDAGV